MKKLMMEAFMDLDSTCFVCPCGQIFTNDNDAIEKDFDDFFREHTKHTNGKLKCFTTNDGARVYDEKPEPYICNINLKAK